MEPVRVGELTGVWSFLKTIDWTDPWLSGLIAFHVMCLLLTYVTRNRGNLQAGYFISLLLMVYFSEKINEFAATHWRKFSRQQYFDSNGLFISLVFSAPLLLNCLIIVGQWILMSGNMMVSIKKAQLRQQAAAACNQTSSLSPQPVQQLGSQTSTSDQNNIKTKED